jgi:hypothetical protein
LLKTSQEYQGEFRPRAYEDFASLLADYAAVLAANPWLDEFPALLSALPDQSGRGLVDVQGGHLPLVYWFRDYWRLAALSGGEALTLFGEWDGHEFLPLTAWCAGELHSLEPTS